MRPKNSKDTKKRKNRSAWTVNDIELLIALYPTTTNAALATTLNKSKDSVKTRARIMGLKKKEGFYEGTV